MIADNQTHFDMIHFSLSSSTESWSAGFATRTEVRILLLRTASGLDLDDLCTDWGLFLFGGRLVIFQGGNVQLCWNISVPVCCK